MPGSATFGLGYGTGDCVGTSPSIGYGSFVGAGFGGPSNFIGFPLPGYTLSIGQTPQTTASFQSFSNVVTLVPSWNGSGHRVHRRFKPLSFPRITGGGKIPLFASENTARVLRNVFRYIFEADYKYGGLAQVELQPLNGPVELFGASFQPLVVMHGDVPIEGYRFGTAAYLTDFSSVPEETLAQLKGLDILFLDALRHHPHPTHSTVENSLKIVERLKPKRTYFTHISHDLPHEATNAVLPENVRLSHDGLKLEFEI